MLDAKKIAVAKSLYKDLTNSPSMIAEALGVSRATLYRYPSPGKYRPKHTRDVDCLAIDVAVAAELATALAAG